MEGTQLIPEPAAESASEPESVPVETLKSARELFVQGRIISERLEASLQKTIESFYRTAIPFAYECLEQKPWKSDDYKIWDDPNPITALYRFLRASFSINRSQKTASQQANILVMLIEEQWGFEQVKDIPFRYLLKMSYCIRYIDREMRTQLLKEAQTTKNIQEFEALVESLKRRVFVEPKKVKFLQASQSAIEILDDFDKRTTELGDTRPEGEKIADWINTVSATEPEIAPPELWDSWAIAGFCRWWRKKEPEFENRSDRSIIADMLFEAWSLDREFFDDETVEEFKRVESNAEFKRVEPKKLEN